MIFDSGQSGAKDMIHKPLKEFSIVFLRVITLEILAILRSMNIVQIQKQIIITSSSSSPEGLYTILKNSEKVIINEVCAFLL